jgi:hypothetical protein
VKKDQQKLVVLYFNVVNGRRFIMADDPLSRLVIRTGVVRQEDTGYLLACDPDEEEKSPHAKIYRWHRGNLSESWVNFNAHTICLINDPEPALVMMSPSGNYAIHGKTSLAGNIFESSEPKPKEARYGDMRAVSEIAGKAYAVGHEGAVYRLDQLSKWTRIDEALPRDFDIEAVHGFDASDIYTVGHQGENWHFDGQVWTRRELNTNVDFSNIKCSLDGIVYIVGHGGLLIRGREDTWQFIVDEELTDDFWDVEWFGREVYVSTLSAVYRLSEEQLKPVDFGDDQPMTSYHLSAARNVMWSIGAKDVLSFDGNKWTRII